MQYNVYDLGSGALVVDVQTDFLDTGTRIVAPLILAKNAPPPIPRLKPQFELANHTYVLHPQELAAVPTAALQMPLADLSLYRDEITRALDIVFHGF
ncbi:MAG: CcdB family protein [Pseudomonadota bacterium]